MVFKQATRTGAKPWLEERSLFKKNRGIFTFNYPPSLTGVLWKNVFIRGVIIYFYPSNRVKSRRVLFSTFIGALRKIWYSSRGSINPSNRVKLRGISFSTLSNRCTLKINGLIKGFISTLFTPSNCENLPVSRFPPLALGAGLSPDRFLTLPQIVKYSLICSKTPKFVNKLNEKKPKITVFPAKITYLAIGLLYTRRDYLVTQPFMYAFLFEEKENYSFHILLIHILTI